MSHRKGMAALKASNKKYQEKKKNELPKCTLCGFMPATRGVGNLYWCKKHGKTP